MSICFVLHVGNEWSDNKELVVEITWDGKKLFHSSEFGTQDVRGAKNFGSLLFYFKTVMLFTRTPSPEKFLPFVIWVT